MATKKPDKFQMPVLPPAAPVFVGAGGIQFKDAAQILASVAHNGICAEDPRVMVRTNEATKMVLDQMIPVGGMASFRVTAINTYLVLPPELENVIEAYPADSNTAVRGDTDITQAWYEIVNNSVYLDPNQHHDNPMIDQGLWPDAQDHSVLRRVYTYPGLQPSNADVIVTGAKRYVPVKSKEDYLIVQNLEALKLMIQAIERFENNATDEAAKYQKAALDLLQAEVKKHILDPRNYMRRKSAYQDDIVSFPENTLGWVRANIALDIDYALRTGKIDLTWSLNQIECRIMRRGIFKDCVITLTAQVTGGMVYFPIYVGSVLAADLSGAPIPIRSQFFQHLENGPGMFPCNEMLIDQGDELFPGSNTLRRKYKLIADCTQGQTISAVCKLRWLPKKSHDMMVIKNYEALRLMMTAKFMEEQEKWQEAQQNQAQAYDLLDKELRDYLAGIRHTVHVQMMGFGLGDVGGYWTQ